MEEIRNKGVHVGDVDAFFSEIAQSDYFRGGTTYLYFSLELQACQ